MSKLAEFRAAEEALKQQLARLEALKNDPKLKTQIQIIEKVEALCVAEGVSLEDLHALLSEKTGKGVKAADGRTGRKNAPRATKVYKNPHNGETIETKGGNHKGLKEWKAKWGAEAVESWKTQG
ncbi:hypothetical protein HNP46_000248 [Pseudomonas nitritireducens]|uniref:MvaT DNA-binding domain-containing protein n=1 Tax=Pseudomonas nitroreducens TaxID=46680 RepID=A0A7W7KEL8_PSENT|nr:histone-like nucleoid-structuring protein, MvaT/MvaU family [Pseudomonas nitritireducens]MBB4861437.1 hypothetical protein [Pseudomonas nitritireducens]